MLQNGANARESASVGWNNRAMAERPSSYEYEELLTCGRGEENAANNRAMAARLAVMSFALGLTGLMVAEVFSRRMRRQLGR